MIPLITKISKSGKESVDLLSYDFNENRRIFLTGEITDTLAQEVIVQLEYLDKAEGDITLYINSPGGAVTAGLAIVDAMGRCKNPVSTVCTGIAASMGALILSCGERGKRFVTNLGEVMIHQPLGGVQGQASDVELVAKHIVRTRKKINKILADNTGKPLSQIAKDCDRDYYMSAEEAVSYGIADKILT